MSVSPRSNQAYELKFRSVIADRNMRHLGCRYRKSGGQARTVYTQDPLRHSRHHFHRYPSGAKDGLSSQFSPCLFIVAIVSRIALTWRVRGVFQRTARRVPRDDPQQPRLRTGGGTASASFRKTMVRPPQLSQTTSKWPCCME